MGSSKKQTIGYKYYLGQHLVLCHGPIDSIRRLEVDDRIAYNGVATGGTIQVSKPELFGGEKREGGVSGLIDIDMGTSTQTANSYLSSVLTGAVPAFRGVVSLIFRDFYFGNNPYLKPWKFRASRVHLRNGGIAQWYDAKAGINYLTGTGVVRSPTLMTHLDFNKGIIETANANDYSAPSFNDSGWLTYTGSFGPANEGFTNTVTITQHVWLRKTVTISNLNPITVFASRIDDDLDVYFNGVFAFRLEIGTNLSGVYNPVSTGSLTIALRLSDIGIGGMVLSGYTVTQPQPTGDLELMNPAHIIRECLTDLDWGMGYAESDIDDTSFTAAADTLFSEDLGLSLLWDKQTAIEDFIGEVLKHIDANLYLDRQTGKFVLKLIRGDYDVATIPEFDETNVIEIETLTKPTLGELISSVSVSYWSPETSSEATVTLQDEALVLQQGYAINTSIQYPGVVGSVMASKLAVRDLRVLSTPLLTVVFAATRDAASLYVGDVFKLTWPNYAMSSRVFRVISIELGDGVNNAIKVTAVEDVFAQPDYEPIGIIASEFEELVNPPAPVDDYIFSEVTYWDLTQTLSAADFAYVTSTTSYVKATAAKPTPDSYVLQLHTKVGAAAYELAEEDAFSPTGVLSSNISAVDTQITMTSADSLEIVEVGSYAQIGSEYVGIDAIDTATLTATISRGVIDTVPVSHTAGDIIFFSGSTEVNDTEEYATGETVNGKLLAQTTQGVYDISLAQELTLPIVGRQNLPYPPGNLLINGQAYPGNINSADDLVFTWAHRDRITQTASLIATTVGNIGPEAGVTYTLRLYDDLGVLFKTVSGISGTSYTYNNETELAENGEIFPALKVEVASVRDGLESFQALTHTFNRINGGYGILYGQTYGQVV